MGDEEEHNYCFSLLSLNVRGLNNETKRKALFDWLRKQSAQIIFLQETYSTQALESKWEQEWGGKIIFAHGTNHSTGTAILFKRGVAVEIVDEEIDTYGRFVYLKGAIENAVFNLLNVYFPNTENEQLHFLKEMRRMLEKKNTEEPLERFIIGGDFNCVQNISLDKKGGNMEYSQNKPKLRDNLKEFMESYSLEDVWRVKNPDVKKFTWRQKRPIIQCRLDYWLTSEQLQDEIENTNIKTAIRTDHYHHQLTTPNI